MTPSQLSAATANKLGSINTQFRGSEMKCFYEKKHVLEEKLHFVINFLSNLKEENFRRPDQGPILKFIVVEAEILI